MLFVFKVLRLIFITIDNAIFELVDLLYQLFMLLAETGIFTTEAIRAFSERIYFFLGLIMVFKVSISLIQYILNPDAVNDGKIGAPKLLKNIVFVLVGIIAVPYIFDAAFSLQRIILKDNIIGNLILGTNLSGKGKNAESVVKETGDIMAFSTFTAFLHFNDDYITSECAAQPFDITEGNNRYATASSVCVGENSKNSQEVKDMLNEFYDSKAGGLYREAYENNNMHKIAGHMKVYNYTFEDAEGDDTFLFDYMLIITTGGGIFLAYVLLIFCFDVAVRAVKLGFLQLIAPIPLIAKIDPKKGDEVFNKWVKECTSTYLNLFIRLVAIYFALYIITLVGSTGKPYNIVTKKDINNPFVYVFIIFGVLLFVKDLPKLIETLTGMKINTGGFGLKNKLGQVPLVGGKLANKLAQGEGYARGKARQFMQNRGGNLAKRLAGQKNPNSRYSTALNKMANGKIGKAFGLDKGVKNLGAKGQDMLETSRNAFQERVNAGRREGMEREKSAGLFGDSGYKGTTIGKTIRQSRFKDEETAFENREQARKYNEKIERGQKTYEAIDGTTALAKKAFNEYIEKGTIPTDANMQAVIKAAQEAYPENVELQRESVSNRMKAQKLFAGNADLQAEYVAMSDAKFVKNKASDHYDEVKGLFERGEIKDYGTVTAAAEAAKKSDSYFNDRKDGFTKILNGSSSSIIENYEAYTVVDNRSKTEKLPGWAAGPTYERVEPTNKPNNGGTMSIDQASIDAMMQSLSQGLSQSINSGMKQAIDSNFGDQLASKIGEAVGNSVSDKMRTEFRETIIPDLENSLNNNNRKQTEIIGETVEEIIEEKNKPSDDEK